MSGTATEHRRADAGTVQLQQRDIDGLVLCAEHGGAPYDLLAAALGVAARPGCAASPPGGGGPGTPPPASSAPARPGAG